MASAGKVVFKCDTKRMADAILLARLETIALHHRPLRIFGKEGSICECFASPYAAHVEKLRNEVLNG